MEQCTTNRGTCKEKDATCCCRALRVEELDISCVDTNTEKLLDPHLKTNASQCTCMPCDDIVITIRLSVKGPSDDGPIPAAQVFDMETEELIGLTLYNGMLDFEKEFRKRKLLLLIQATGYQRITRAITLSPKQTMVLQNITMSRLVAANIGHGKSEVVFPLGKWAWLYAEPGSFHKNGTTHNHDIVFKGSYMDSGSTDILDMIASEKFEVDGSQFAMLAAVFLEFEDTEGEPLSVDDLRLAIPLDDGEEDVDVFAAMHDWETGEWKKISTFLPVKAKRGKRSTISECILEAPNINVSQFLAIAIPIGADCWAQVRTFDLTLAPFPGPLVSLVQRRSVAGMDVLYRFGTDTGGAQTSDDSFSPNAVCIPLDCNDFLEVTITARVDPNRQLRPVPFPDNTFATDPGDPPILTDNSFILTALTPADIAQDPRPIYVFRENCIKQARESQALTDQRDYFSFSTGYTLPLSSDQCYIRITIRDCYFRQNTVTVTSLDAQTGEVNSVRTFGGILSHESLTVGSGFPEECLSETTCPSMCTNPRPMCLPYSCSNSIEINVASNAIATGQISTCELTGVSPILDNSILAFRGDTWQEDLTIDTSVLDPESFNNPELGLYYDPQPTLARSLCEAQGTREGSAAEFGCFSDTP